MFCGSINLFDQLPKTIPREALNHSHLSFRTGKQEASKGSSVLTNPKKREGFIFQLLNKIHEQLGRHRFSKVIALQLIATKFF